MNSEYFKKILKESISSNADSIFSDEGEIVSERQVLKDRDFIIRGLESSASDIQTICKELNVNNLSEAIKYYIIASSFDDDDISFASELLSSRFETLVTNIIEKSIKGSSITKLFEDLFKSIGKAVVFSDPANYIDSLIKAGEKQKLLGLKKLITTMESSSVGLGSQLAADIETIITKEKDEGLGSPSACVSFSGTSRTSAQKSNDIGVAQAAEKDKKGPALGKQNLNQFRIELQKIEIMRTYIPGIIEALIRDIPESKKQEMMKLIRPWLAGQKRRLAELITLDDEDSDTGDTLGDPKSNEEEVPKYMEMPEGENLLNLLLSIKIKNLKHAKIVYILIRRFLNRNGLTLKKTYIDRLESEMIAVAEKDEKSLMKSLKKSLRENISEKKYNTKITNETNRDISDLTEMLESFYPFAKERLKYDRDPEMVFKSDPENGKRALGKTAHYEPGNMTVTVYIDNRHPKDIMRSLSHELVHHTQNCDGQFDNILEMGEGYAQSDEHLRKMEEDAYLRGNMCFRDWEDEYKQTNRAFGNQLKENRERLYYELMRRFK
jgi:hypothetical protein